jgi:hypothetical protein
MNGRYDFGLVDAPILSSVEVDGVVLCDCQVVVPHSSSELPLDSGPWVAQSIGQACREECTGQARHSTLFPLLSGVACSTTREGGLDVACPKTATTATTATIDQTSPAELASGCPPASRASTGRESGCGGSQRSRGGPSNQGVPGGRKLAACRRGGRPGRCLNDASIRRLVQRGSLRSGVAELGECGGQGRDRTADLAVFSRTLYRLSYLPAGLGGGERLRSATAVPTGFEPATSALTGPLIPACLAVTHLHDSWVSVKKAQLRDRF